MTPVRAESHFLVHPTGACPTVWPLKSVKYCATVSPPFGVTPGYEQVIWKTPEAFQDTVKVPFEVV
jgi:hypothetical protein